MATPIEPAATPKPAMTQPCFESRNCRSPVPKGTGAEAQLVPPSLVRYSVPTKGLFESGTSTHPCAASRKSAIAEYPSALTPDGLTLYQVTPPSSVRKTSLSLMPQPLFASIMWMDTSEGVGTIGALTGGTEAG